MKCQKISKFSAHEHRAVALSLITELCSRFEATLIDYVTVDDLNAKIFNKQRKHYSPSCSFAVVWRLLTQL